MVLLDAGVKCISLFQLKCNAQFNLPSSSTAKIWGDLPVMANPPEQERTGDFGITEDLLSGVGVYYAPTNGNI
jgi:hypothetical protein